MRKFLAVIALVALGVTSCSAPEEPAPKSSVSVQPAKEAESSPTATQSAVNDHGNLVKEIGETAALGGDTVSESAVKFKVTSIKPVECTGWPDLQSVNGHMIAVELEVETTKDMREQLGMDVISFDAHYWKGYAANGSRMTSVQAKS